VRKRIIQSLALLIVMLAASSKCAAADDVDVAWDTTCETHQRVIWSGHHDEIPAGVTCYLPVNRPNQAVVADNAFFDEGLTADSRCMIYSNRRTYLTYLGETDKREKYSDMPVYVVAKDEESGKWGDPVCLGPSGTSFDTHYFPVIVADNRGYLHVFYGCHNTAMKYRRSLKPNDITSWTDEITLGGMVSYPRAFTLPDGRIYVFARGREYLENRCISFIYSTDYGRSWSDWNIVAFNDLDESARAYLAGLVVDKNQNPTRLHIAFYFTEKPVGIETGWAKECFYAYSDFDPGYPEGFHRWRKSRGDFCGVTGSSPMTSALTEIVTRSENGHERERSITNLYLDRNGKPHIIIVQSPFGGDRWNYYLADAFNPGREWKLNRFGKSLNMPVWHARQGTSPMVDEKGSVHVFCVACPKHYKIYLPTSDGNHSDWSRSDEQSEAFALVDDDIIATDLDTTCLYASSDGAKVSLRTEVNLPETAKILAVDVSYIARSLSGESAALEPFLTFDSTEWYADRQPIDSLYFSSDWPVKGHGEYHHTWKENPATGRGWRFDDLGNIEFGLMFRSQFDSVEAAVTRVQLRVLVMQGDQDPDWFTGEIMEFYTSGDRKKWNYRILPTELSCGLPMLNLAVKSEHMAEIAYVAGSKIYGLHYNADDMSQNIPGGIRLVYDSDEIEQIACDDPGPTCLAFCLPDSIRKNAEGPPGTLYAYTDCHDDTEPKQSASAVFPILAESFESYDSGESIDGKNGWTIEHGSASVFQASQWEATSGPNHNSRVYSGLQSLFCSGIGDSTSVARTVDDDNSNLDVTASLWLDTSGGCRCYMELSDSLGNVFRVGFYGAGRCGVYFDTIWHESAVSGAPSNQYVVKARVTEHGVTASFRGEEICTDNPVITSVKSIRLKTEGTEAYFDQVYVARSVANPGEVELDKANRRNR